MIWSTSLSTPSVYFGAIWAVIGALLIFLKHLHGKLSVSSDIALWAVSIPLAGWLTWVIAGSLHGIALPLALCIGLGFLARAAISHVTPFGVGMTIQSFFLPLSGLLFLESLIEANSWPVYVRLAFWIFVLSAVVGNSLRLYFVFSPLSKIFRRYTRRDEALKTMSTRKGLYCPKVSIHLPCYAEPPELVIATLNAISRLRYADFEVLVIDNNTKDPALWRPVQEHCARLGPNYRFFHVDPISGAKAGALNFALEQTATDAELVAVIDADYLTEPDFLEKYTPLFEDPSTGFVQTSHDYHSCEKSLFLTGAYYEYVPVHKLTFPSLSEHDGSFTVGTMCVFRREALVKAGGWAEWSMTEDSEVAVRIHAAGYTGHTFADTAGRGLIPETMDGLKRQQFRWTVGPVQQFKKHWRLYFGLDKTGHLNLAQKVVEVQHSFSRLESVLAFFAAIPVLLAALYAIHNQLILQVPICALVLIAALAFSTVIEGWVTVRQCGGHHIKNYFYGLLIRSALQWTYVHGFFAPLLGMRLSWQRTDKFKQTSSIARAFHASRTETLLAAAFFAIGSVLLRFAQLGPIDYVGLASLYFFAQGLQFSCTLAAALIGEYELRRANDANVSNPGVIHEVCAAQNHLPVYRTTSSPLTSNALSV